MADIPEIHELGEQAIEARLARQVEREREMIAEGQAQIDRGEYLEEDELEAWLDALESDPDTPLPLRPGRMR